MDTDGDSDFDLVQRYALDGWNPAQRGQPEASATGYGNERFDVWADLDGESSLTSRYLHGDEVDQILARIEDDGAAAWMLTERLGSVVGATDGDGVLRVVMDYDGFGNMSSASITGNPLPVGRYTWTGREWDTETTFQYNRARYYYPRIGKWTTEDPIGISAGDSNLYRYVHNRYQNATDPSGLQSQEYWQALAHSKLRDINDPIERNKLITSAYAEMYLKNPEVYKFIGLAAFGSQEVGKAMVKARDGLGAVFYGNLGTSGLWVLTHLPGPAEAALWVSGFPNPAYVLDGLGKGNLAVFNDIYWQHLAFHKGGLQEIEKHQKALATVQLEGWRKIAAGIRTKSPALIDEGNVLLFRQEQQVTLQQTVYDQYPGTFERSSKFAESVVPRLTKNRQFLSFRSYLPSGNFANFKERWAWFGAAVWEDWLYVSFKKPTELQAIVKKLMVK